jgi:SAM-dependent methyltransferase
MLEKWLEEEKKAMIGWDFSYLDGRWEEEDLPWKYEEIVKDYLKETYQLLDLGTGGGEFLLTLQHPYEHTSVTEGYKPNYELCKDTLEPLGITVRYIENDQIPYDDDSFDLIISRHESFDADEVYRCLKPGGIFITQQIGGLNSHDLAVKILGDFEPMYKEVTKENLVSMMNRFEILNVDESFTHLKFYDIGAIIYFAKIIEWEFPGFSVEKYYDQLADLEHELQRKGYVHSLEHRIIVVAQKNS